jgi:hypothetical protein
VQRLPDGTYAEASQRETRAGTGERKAEVIYKSRFVSKILKNAPIPRYTIEAVFATWSAPER